MIPSTTGSIRLILLALSRAASQLPGSTPQPIRMVLVSLQCKIYWAQYFYEPACPVLRVQPHDGQEQGGHPGAGAGHLLSDVAEPRGEQDREEDGDGHEQPEEQVGLRCTVFDFFIKKISIY